MTSRRHLRIAFIVTGDGGGGTYFRYHNFAKGLVLLGHQVRVYGQGVARWSSRRETREGVEYILAPSAPGNRVIPASLNPGNLFWRLAQIQKVEPADVYHLFQPHENSAALWRILQKTHAKEGTLFAWDWDDLWCRGLIASAPASGLARLNYRLLDHFEHTLPQRAGLVTTCSEYLTRLAKERGATQTATIHNGYWPASAPGDRAALRRALGLRPEAFYLGFIGWTPTEVSWCLETLAQLDSNVRLASCGYDIRQNLDAFPGLADRVDYLGKLPAEDARRLMNAIDVGLLPLADSAFNQSRLPIKFADYLAAGVPAICGDVGEVGALGRRIRGAILCPPEREGWVAGSVTAIHEIQRNATAHAPDTTALENQLSWLHLVHQLESAYISALPRLAAEVPNLAGERPGVSAPFSEVVG